MSRMVSEHFRFWTKERINKAKKMLRNILPEKKIKLKSPNDIFVNKKKICGILQETVKKLISISQLDSVFKITPTLNEAIDLVYMEEVEREI